MLGKCCYLLAILSLVNNIAMRKFKEKNVKKKQLYEYFYGHVEFLSPTKKVGSKPRD